jgi:septal ring factor EnvC (AmiA/AmiB activator)
MRFLSIIGLCLMAVFALVQGIPVPEKGKSVQSSQAARLRQDVRAQQVRVQELQAGLHTLKSAMFRTQRVLVSAEHHLVQLARQTQEARVARDRLEAQVDGLGHQLEQGRRELADIEQASMQEQQNLAELQGRLSGVQAQLDRSRRQIAKLKRQSRQLRHKAVKPAADTRPPPAPAPVSVTSPEPDRQGFTLRFVSDEALDRLVAAGRVTLYAMADKQAWRLSLDAGRPAAARGPYPGWFHEMSAVTVPAHYLHGLDKVPDGPGRSAVVWGVQLPSATRQAIASLTRGQPGGELVIRGDGQVVLGE